MTSIAVTLGTKSLLQIGFGIGDIATLVSLGRTAGNWLTAQSGDDDFLKTVSGDDSVIPWRRGLVDLESFNKRWRKNCRLLVNGYPQKIEQSNLNFNLGTFGRFTAIMVSVTTVLDAFMSTLGVSLVVEGLLKEMLRTTDLGEDLLKADLGNRIQAWRSTGVMRGMSHSVRSFRLGLVGRGHVLSSYPPITEMYHFRHLLIWLLLGKEHHVSFNTPSSDVAAVALCLSYVAFDLLDVHGLEPREGISCPSCTVHYDPSTTIFPILSEEQMDSGIVASGQKRIECSTVPLIGRDDAVSIYPLSAEGRAKCRFAWVRGQAAAQDIIIDMVVPTSDDVDNCHDLTYSFSTKRSTRDPAAKSKLGRTPFAILANKLAFVGGDELYYHIREALEDFEQHVDWLTMQTSDGQIGEGDDGWVASPKYNNLERIEAFSVMQSFFLGYHYELFLRFVDTASLEMQAVEGDWGFRSTNLLTRMRQYCVTAKKEGPNGVARLKRQDVIEILCALLLNRRVHLETRTRFNHCIGVVGKRTLLTASLLRPTDCPAAVGRFVLLDVDTGGIPRDSEGLIRPGVTETDLECVTDGHPFSVVQGQPAIRHSDLTRHIEPDWAGNRDKLLLTFRHEGRRLFSLNTAETDLRICHSYVVAESTPLSNNDTSLNNAIPTGLEDLLKERLQTGAFGEHSTYFQAYNCPNLRYAAVGIHQSNDLRLASTSAPNALTVAPRELPAVIVAPEGPVGRAIRREAVHHFHPLEQQE